MEIRAEIMEVVAFWKKVVSVVIVWTDTKEPDVKLTLTTAKITNVKIMEHVWMVFNLIRVVARLVSLANFARRKFNFVEMNLIPVQITRNASIIIRITRVSVCQDFEELIARKISMTAKITCVKMEVRIFNSFKIKFDIQKEIVESFQITFLQGVKFFLQRNFPLKLAVTKKFENFSTKKN